VGFSLAVVRRGELLMLLLPFKAMLLLERARGRKSGGPPLLAPSFKVQRDNAHNQDLRVSRRLIAAPRLRKGNGTAERRASEIMLKAKSKAAGHRITAGEDKAYDTADHVAHLRAITVTPHVTQNQAVTKTGKTRNSAIDERTTRHPGYDMSQSRRAMIECIFGWGKQHGTMRKTKHRGIGRVAADFMLNLIAYNLIRIPKLVAA
jgi:hypothetical protein